MDKYVAMFKLKNDRTQYYDTGRYNTENGVITQLKRRKIHNEARITFMLKLSDVEIVQNYFPDAVEYQGAQ